MCTTSWQVWSSVCDIRQHKDELWLKTIEFNIFDVKYWHCSAQDNLNIGVWRSRSWSIQLLIITNNSPWRKEKKKHQVELNSFWLRGPSILMRLKQHSIDIMITGKWWININNPKCICDYSLGKSGWMQDNAIIPSKMSIITYHARDSRLAHWGRKQARCGRVI